MSSPSQEYLLGTVYRTVYMIKRKSKFDLSSPAILKVPKSQYTELKKITDNTNIHWSELSRLILDWWIKTGQKKEKVLI